VSTKQVARALLGRPVGSLALSSEAVRKGRANSGCFVHTAEADDGRRIMFFEKRTSLDREIHFFENVAQQFLTDNPPILPRIHRIFKRKAYTAIFMDLIDFVGLDFSRDKSAACALATAIARISDVSPEDVPRGANFISSNLIQRFAAAAAQLNYRSSAEARYRSLFDQCSESAATLTDQLKSRLLMVPCHNDIYMPNMAMTRDGGSPHFCFVDWGKFSLNFAGSDFHHFEFEASGYGKGRAFVDSAYEYYSSVMNELGHTLDVADVRLAASYYSLQRSMSRVLNRPSIQGVEKSTSTI